MGGARDPNGFRSWASRPHATETEAQSGAATQAYSWFVLSRRPLKFRMSAGRIFVRHRVATPMRDRGIQREARLGSRCSEPTKSSKRSVNDSVGGIES